MKKWAEIVFLTGIITTLIIIPLYTVLSVMSLILFYARKINYMNFFNIYLHQFLK